MSYSITNLDARYYLTYSSMHAMWLVWKSGRSLVGFPAKVDAEKFAITHNYHNSVGE